MTAALDLHPHPGHPAAVAAGVHEALDELSLDDLSSSELAAVIGEWERAIRRMEAAKLRLVAAADRADVALDAGCRDTAAWLSRETRSGSAAGAGTVRLATELDSRLPATQHALGQGDLSPAHARVIAQATRQLPPGLSAAQTAAVETRLVEQAGRMDPQRLRRAARRALEAAERDPRVVDAHENQLVENEEEAALAKATLTLHDNDDGTTTGHFTVPTLAASMLRKILNAMTAPRRAGHRGRAWTPDTDPAHERGRAFTEVLEHLPTDHLHGKVAATVVVTIDLATLRGQLKAAQLDTGDLVSAAQARRLACQSGLVPAVLDGAGHPLDLGRTQRLFTEHHRLAGATRFTTCVEDGCTVPYAWCELHHRQPWSRGGTTDMRDLEPRCGFHHRQIHRRM